MWGAALGQVAVRLGVCRLSGGLGQHRGTPGTVPPRPSQGVVDLRDRPAGPASVAGRLPDSAALRDLVASLGDVVDARIGLPSRPTPVADTGADSPRRSAGLRQHAPNRGPLRPPAP